MRGGEKNEVVLGTVGIVDAGVYAPDKTYHSGMFVLDNGSTWLALKNNLLGVTPEEGENWKYLARGFASEMLSLITAIDSQGLLGDKGAEVSGQDLFDKFADMVANKVIQKSVMSNVQVNDQNKVPTSALAFNMQQQITSNKTLVDQLNSDMTVITGQAKPWNAKVTTNNCKRIGKIAFCEIWAYKEYGTLIAQESLFSLPWKPESSNMHVCAVGRVTNTGATVPVIVDIDEQYGVVRANQDQDSVNEIRFYLVYLTAA